MNEHKAATGSAPTDVHRRPTEHTTSTGISPLDGDEDNDNPTSSHYDADDGVVLSFGHAASAAQLHAIGLVVRRYYIAAATGDAKAACSLIYSVLAESSAEEVGYHAGNSTCLHAMAYFFRLDRSQFKADATKIAVTRVRTMGDRGVVLVLLGHRERRVLVHLEHREWKIDTLADMGVP